MIDLSSRIRTTPEQIAGFCRRRNIQRLAFFGSVLRDDFGPDSDVDVLVKFHDGAKVSAFDIVHIIDDLAEMFGRGVDLVEEGATRNPYRRERIMSTRQVIYDAA